jgi:hypothetical protein
MHDYGTVLERVVVPVYLVDSGFHTMSSMEAIIYQQPYPVLVLTRTTLMPNATDATGSYTLISGATLEDWKQSLAESDSMLWKTLPRDGSGLDLNF